MLHASRDPDAKLDISECIEKMSCSCNTIDQTDRQLEE